MSDERRSRPWPQAGFTLVEALVAMLVLVVGIVGVASLLALAAGSSTAAGQSSAATACAVAQMERLRAASFLDLREGGTLEGPGCVDGAWSRCEAVAGVGAVATRWQLTRVASDLYAIAVRAEVDTPFGRARSRVELAALRSCTVGSGAGACP